jgi:hypothetical protein
MDTDIVGTINYNESDDRLLIFTIDKDTLPLNTLKSVDSIINPQLKGPGHGLPTAVAGQRYLIVEPIGSSRTASIDNSIWGNVIAKANDIIEYNGTTQLWQVSFDSNATTIVEYVTNLTSGVQYRFTDNSWIKSFEGWYDQGDYNIVI